MSSKRELRNQLILAQQHLHHKRWAKALEALKRAADLDPDNLELLFQVASLCQNQNQPAEALKYLENILSREPGHYYTLVLKGNILLSRGAAREALSSFVRASEIREDPEVHYNIGICYRSLREAARAEESFLRVWKLAPKEAVGLMAAAQVARERGRVEEARLTLERAVRSFPHYAPAKEDLAQLYVEIKRLDLAEGLLRDLLLKGHKTPEVYHRLGLIEAERGKWQEALVLWNEVIQRSPTADETLREMGWTHHLLKHPKEAEQFLKRALEINPENTKALIDLGTVYFAGGWVQGAVEAWSKAMEKEPGNQVLQRHLDQARELKEHHGPVIFPDPGTALENGSAVSGHAEGREEGGKVIPLARFRPPRSRE